MDVAAQRTHVEIGPLAPDLRLAPQRRRAQACAARKFRLTTCPQADQRVARIFAFEIGGDRQSVRQYRRHILRRMNREVDLTGSKRNLDFLGEKAFAASVGQQADFGSDRPSS